MVEITGNYEDFIKDLDNFEKIAKNKINRIVKLVTIEFFTAVIKDTPVDTGRAQASWHFSHGQAPKFDAKPAGTYSKDPLGGPTKTKIVNEIRRAPGVMEKMQNVNNYYLTNNTPYIRILEFGEYPKKETKGVTSDGWSKKAIGGFARKNLRKYGNMNLTHIVKGVKGKL